MSNNIYDESDDRTQPVNPVLIEIDFSKKQTLHEIIQMLRHSFSKPEVNNPNTVIYIVSDLNLNDIDYYQLISFMKNTLNYQGRLFFRGIVHFDFFGLFSELKCEYDSSTLVYYSAQKLNLLLRQIKDNKPVLNRFLSRYTDVYFQYLECYLPVTELELLIK